MGAAMDINNAPARGEASVEKLSLILWRERELLETLHYRLEVEQLVMAHGQTRWLATAARDVERVLDQVREVELLRAIAADEAAARLGLAPNPSLTALVAATEDPWSSILADHRDAFATTSEAIFRVADANRSLIASGLRAAHETLLGLQGTVQTYSPSGDIVSEGARPVHLDRSL
ncbi:MAG: flagellar export chaperone FlgN [Nocardioides sp.]